MADKEPSLIQLSWTIKDAAFLAGISVTQIRNLIRNGFLMEKNGEIRSLGKGKIKDFFIITRKGMTKLTGHEFKTNDLVVAQELYNLIKRENRRE